MSKYPARSKATQTLLDNGDFLTSLSSLLSQDSGSIYLTQKRLADPYVNGTLDSLTHAIVGGDVGETGHTLLFRATNGKDIKISTRVKTPDLLKFMERYGDLCRSQMSAGLKKRERKKVRKT